MKKIFKSGIISMVFGSLCLAFVLGGGLVSADATVTDPSAQIFQIMLYFGGGFLLLGLILVISATLTLKR